MHEMFDDIVSVRGLNPDDDVEKILQIIHDQLADDYGIDEGWKGRAIGTVAGMALAPEVPGSGTIGGYIGDKIGDKISPDKDETDEGYDSPLDTPDAKAAREKLAKAMAPVKKQHPNHPALKNFEESTALTGQYGHSGKLQAVQPQDQDMMDRIKFLAGITK